MSRIYESQAGQSRYRETDKSVAYNPVRATSGEKQAQQWKQQVIQDGETRARELQRASNAQELETRLTMQAEASGLKVQQLAEEIELKTDQTYEQGILKQEQLHENLVLNAEQRTEQLALQLKGQVQSANMRAMSGAIQGILSFAGSAMKYAEVQHQMDQAEAEKQAVIDSGAWAFGDDFSIDSPAGVETVQAEQAQNNIEIVEEQAVVNAVADPVQQEQLRESIGVGQSTQRVQRQLSVGEASASIGGRLMEAFYDPNRAVTIRDNATGQLKTIRPMDAKGTELYQVLRSLGQALTRESGLASADRYAAVKQYVPALQSAIDRLYNQEFSGRIAGQQANRESLGFRKAAQTLATGDIAGAWSDYYTAAATSGMYDGDQAKITRAAVEAFVADATPAQLEQLKNGGVRVFAGGPTFANDKRFSNLIDQAIRAKNAAAITDFNQGQKFQAIELSNATNSFQEALMNADSPEATQQAHAAYEAELSRLASAGNSKARMQLTEELNRQNNYNPKNYQAIRERIANGETFTKEFLLGELASGRINESEYQSAYKVGLATPEAKQKAYGGREAYNASGSRAKSLVTAGLFKDNPFLESALPEIRSGAVSNITQDIIRRRDTAVNEFVAGQGGEVDPGEVAAFADSWLQSNVPGLVANVKVDEQTGAVSGYTYMGQTSAASSFRPVESFSSAYVKNPDGTAYEAKNYTRLNPSQLRGVLAKGENINYAGDSILTREEKLAGAKAYVSGNAFPASIVSKATALGVTPAYLVREQARGIGKDLGAMPTQQPPSQTQKMGLNGAGDPTDLRSGASYLRMMGVPAKGAAYLAGNIQQESGWNGMRSWGGVYNPTTGAMDGTSRNGGLVSWASWSNDPARLGKIEAYLGKDISKATHAEQLSAMMWEMKTSYKSAYRVFMNPLATDAQLRRASYQYWGYGHEGARFKYANEVLRGSLI